MNVAVKSLYQASLEFDGKSVTAIGPFSLLSTLQKLKDHYGPDPKKWLLNKPLQSNDDLLIHEFIQSIHAKPALVYQHEELCHCRMVPAEKVHQSIKQGCRDVKEIARTTLAGTGCGTCRKDSEEILADLFGVVTTDQ